MESKTSGKKWKVGEAKEKFSHVIREAAKEPQFIFSRDRFVAAVVSPETFHAFESWEDREKRASLAEVFADLRRLCLKEGYTWELPQRSDRANVFADALDDVSG